ncbi:DUF6086 family protein [Streptomyces sp. HD]|uniref:DUF6086 family protein n=1 Tax=Streptomyces sp. HD TaxID=3020892 RepID=UPI00232DEB5A|nr:DUF6086 family protein [Streptomyces sp. HD]MDC0767521.1 DUF6086 family protein [Streptomyces sp. HD]
MSQYYEVAGEPVWNPGQQTSQLFLAYVRVYEAHLAVPSGFGPMVSDECQIDPDAFEEFVNALLDWYDHTGSNLLSSLVEGFLAPLLALAERVGAEPRWPERSAGTWAPGVRGAAAELLRSVTP